jgi:hypothetical protein
MPQCTPPHQDSTKEREKVNAILWMLYLLLVLREM